jgi:hypothetical protein
MAGKPVSGEKFLKWRQAELQPLGSLLSTLAGELGL